MTLNAMTWAAQSNLDCFISMSACLILQLSELEVLEIVEQLANPSKDEGEWIAKIDLVESGIKLKLVEQVTCWCSPHMPAQASIRIKESTAVCVTNSHLLTSTEECQACVCA